jgi:hypothetical protein
VRQALAEELDELAHHTFLSQHFRDGENEVGGGSALGQPPV